MKETLSYDNDKVIFDWKMHDKITTSVHPNYTKTYSLVRTDEKGSWVFNVYEDRENGPFRVVNGTCFSRLAAKKISMFVMEQVYLQSIDVETARDIQGRSLIIRPGSEPIEPETSNT